MEMTRKADWSRAFAVIRVEQVGSKAVCSSEPGPPHVTVKEIVLTADEAISEVERLNKEAAAGDQYFWQGTHLFLDGGSHGGRPDAASDRRYHFVVGSDVERDGMFVEVTDTSRDPAVTLAEVFYSDRTCDFAVSCFEPGVPLDVLADLIAIARRRLVPSVPTREDE